MRLVIAYKPLGRKAQTIGEFQHRPDICPDQAIYKGRTYHPHEDKDQFNEDVAKCLTSTKYNNRQRVTVLLIDNPGPAKKAPTKKAPTKKAPTKKAPTKKAAPNRD